MKLLLFYFGLFLSYLCPSYIIIFSTKIRNHIYSGFKSRKFKKFGKHSLFHYPVFIKGEQSISIGQKATILEKCKITAWEKYNGYIFKPEIIIGDNVFMSNNCHITAINSIYIGNNVVFGNNITIADNSHGKVDFENMKTPPLKRKLYSKGKIIIKENVWIGDKTTILGNVTIGEGAVIGANSVISKDIPAYSVVVGNSIILKVLDQKSI